MKVLHSLKNAYSQYEALKIESNWVMLSVGPVCLTFLCLPFAEQCIVLPITGGLQVKHVDKVR